MSERISMSSSRKKNKKRAHPWAFPLGLLIALLCIIGLVTVIIAGIGTVNKAIIKSKKIDNYNTLLTPVVMNDPDTFDDLSKADMSQLVDISIWSILKSNLSPDKYQYGDDGMIIPEGDVTAEYTKLFGTEVSPVHSTVAGYGYEFTYDAAKRCYIIPVTGVVPTYTPNVVDVDKKNKTIVLTVAYLAGDKWAQNSQGEMIAPEPDKYVKVTLREKDGQYYISALQATSNPETASTVASQTTPQTVIAETTTAPVAESSVISMDNMPTDTIVS